MNQVVNDWGWDLYVCEFIVQIREYKDDENFELELIEKNHHIETVLFKAESCDKAYNWAVEMMARQSDSDNDGKYGRREFECVGILNLSNPQVALSELHNEVKKEYGFTLNTTDIDGIEERLKFGMPEKSRLSLFTGLDG